jgi:hypothetical protein
MSKVVVSREQMDELLESAVDALNLMGNVHADAYDEYYRLQNILDKLNVENLDD